MMLVLFCFFMFVSGASGQLKPCAETGHGNLVIISDSPDVKPVKIFEMPDASYPDTARDTGISGTVILKVRFLAGGRIGLVTVVSGLPEGLTNEAVNAARKIKFLPAKQSGRMINTSEMVEYHFSDPGKCSPGTASAVRNLELTQGA